MRELKNSVFLALPSTALLIGFLALLLSQVGYGAVSEKPARTTPVSPILAAKIFTLHNGLQVVVVPDRKSPKIVHMVWYKVGAADDLPGKSGLAHFVEHLTFRGTKTLPGQQFFRKLEGLSAKQDGVTAYDYTVYYQMGAAKQLATFMQFEADRMANVTITERSVASGRKSVLQERRHTNSSPHAVLDEHMQAAFYRDHPYGTPVLGWPREMDAITGDEAIAFYRQWYVPNNAIVVIYGHVTAEEIRPLAERYYGGVSAQPIPTRRIQRDVEGRNAGPVVIKDNRVRTPLWRRDYFAPSYAAGATQHAYALQVLAEILGGAPTSRLNQSLVVKKAMASEVTVDYHPDSLGPTAFSISVVLRRGAKLNEVQDAVDFELQTLIANGPSSDEMVRAIRDTKINTASFDNDVPIVAQFVGAALVNGRTLEDLKAWSAQITAVTAEQVRQAARAIFALERSVTGVLLAQ